MGINNKIQELLILMLKDNPEERPKDIYQIIQKLKVYQKLLLKYVKNYVMRINLF